MIQTATIPINGKELEAASIQTETSFILLIKGSKGFLGCGYFSIDAANKLNEAVAIVTGVNTFDDMLDAAVVAASTRALELGIKEGMSGKEALEKLI